MGMCTADWQKIKPSRVLVASLVPSQEHLSFAALAGAPSSHCGDPVPHAVLWDGRLFVVDGHHRVIRATLAREATLDVRVAVPFAHFTPVRCAA